MTVSTAVTTTVATATTTFEKDVRIVTLKFGNFIVRAKVSTMQ